MQIIFLCDSLKTVILHFQFLYLTRELPEGMKKNKKFSNNIDINNAFYIEAKEESIASKLQGRQVVDCIRLLPLGYRTVLNLYAIEGYSHKEIGETLGIEESTSRSQLVKARNMLQNKVRDAQKINI